MNLPNEFGLIQSTLGLLPTLDNQNMMVGIMKHRAFLEASPPTRFMQFANGMY